MMNSHGLGGGHAPPPGHAKITHPNKLRTNSEQFSLKILEKLRTISLVLIQKEWASGQEVRALDCCAKHRWFEPNPRIIVGMLAHCSPSSKWVPGGNTRGKLKAARKGTGHPISLCRRLRISVLSNRHSPTYGIVQGTHLFLPFIQKEYRQKRRIL